MSQLSRPLSTIPYLKNVLNKNMHILSFTWYKEHTDITRKVYLRYVDNDGGIRKYSREVLEILKTKSKEELQTLKLADEEKGKENEEENLRDVLFWITVGIFLGFVIDTGYRSMYNLSFCELKGNFQKEILKTSKELAQMKKILKERQVNQDIVN